MAGGVSAVATPLAVAWQAYDRPPMVRHLLVVCTANACRSPVAERLLARELAGRRDVDGEQWVVSSAGIARRTATIDPNTIRAADAIGLDLGGHVGRSLHRTMLSTEGADLVVTMTREQLRAVVALDAGAWDRTFTLKELARRAAGVGPVSVDDGGFAAWRRRLGAGRRAADLVRPDPDDDVADPYGDVLAAHQRMVAEVDVAISDFLRSAMWAPATTH